MNIACDMRVFLSGETGIGTFYKNLLDQLALIDEENRYLLLSSSWKVRFPVAKVPDFANRRLVDARIPVKVLNGLWNHLPFPALESLFNEKVDISHSPTPMLLPCRGKRIITIHDLFPLARPHLVQGENRSRFPERLRKNVSRADGIVCISHATRARLLTVFPDAEAKTRVIHLGVSPRFFADPGQAGGLREKYRLPEKYALFTGTIEPRKNLPMLLQALLALKRDGIVVPLVIAGGRGWELAPFLRLKEELRGQVHEIGYVDSGELPGLYRGAQFFVFPSLEEGFGLPLLESMAAGTPVLCSDIPVFHEIGGRLPVFFDLADVSGLAAEISALWERGKETGMEERIAHARKFTWPESATQTLAFYRQLEAEQQ
jgi:glycosyltransferase involved in cell wall biosynthesis